MASACRNWLEKIGDMWNWIERRFPERTLHLRTEGSIRFFRVSTFGQIACVFLMAGVLGWTAFATASFALRDKMLLVKEDQIANSQIAYLSTLNQLADYQRRFDSLASDLTINQATMTALVEQNAMLQANMATVEQRMHEAHLDRAEALNQRAQLQAQMEDLQEQMQLATRRNGGLRERLEQVDASLKTAMTERDRAQQNSEKARKRVADLERLMVELEGTKKDSVERLISQAETFIGSAEKVIDLAGLELDEVEGRTEQKSSERNGQGGPFIAALDLKGSPSANLRASLGQLDRSLSHSENLQDFVRRLPLIAPLSTYQISSSYGKRQDPINKKYAMHYGLDLRAPMRSPVYATAPGTVIFAAWNSKMGRMVEIDHGAGVHTRYAHMDKITVKKGQKVGFRQEIGLLGNSGRSTGPHVHYEVLFNGRPRDPMKFIEAGLYVFQEQR